jgi:nucleotide-binding universal stress UspA family protein
MAYKTLLTIATNPEKAALTLAAAAEFALANDAHLDAIALGVDQLPLDYSYMGAVVMPTMTDYAATQAKTTEAALTAAVIAQSPVLRAVVSQAITQTGTLTDYVAERARFADMVVLSCPAEHDLDAESVLEAALFGGAAPVLLVPEGNKLPAKPAKIIIAWNNSREALTAVRYAMPLLLGAEMVDIVIVAPINTEGDPGVALCQMLVRHGVKAQVTVLAKDLPRITDVLRRHATEQAADLLVMGAYTHSRLRESVLGGSTREILRGTRIAVLMAH